MLMINISLIGINGYSESQINKISTKYFLPLVFIKFIRKYIAFEHLKHVLGDWLGAIQAQQTNKYSQVTESRHETII